MVAIKKAAKRTSSAPIIEVPLATCKLSDIEWSDEPTTVTTKDGSRSFTKDPGLNAKVTILDDHGEGEHDNVTFWQLFRMKWNEDDKENGYWELRDGTSLGAIAQARYGAGFIEDDREFDPEDFEDFRFMCKIVPKKNPSTGQLCGSMCHHETIMAIPAKKRKKSQQVVEEPDVDEPDFSDLNY
jgi:hypothetical protein